MPSIYVVDACSLFALKDFPEDVFPTLWESLEPLIEGGRLIAPREVFREVEAGDDEVTRWARGHRGMFIDLDDATTRCIQEVLGRFEALRDTTRYGPVFADPVLVALCLARTRAAAAAGEQGAYYVVTEERLKGPGALKIPNLCQPFGLTAIPLIEMFRREGFRF